jgi:hypothetical protein
MAILLKNCRILHCGKTGGSWINEAISRSGVDHLRLGGSYEHLELHQFPDDGVPTISCVRKPPKWIRSFWAYRQRQTPKNPSQLDEIMCNDLHKFVDAYLRERKGYMTEMFEKFVGEPGNEIDHVCRNDTLLYDLIDALRLCGEVFDEAEIRSTPRINANKYIGVPELTPDQVDGICESEAAFIERFWPTEADDNRAADMVLLSQDAQ